MEKIIYQTRLLGLVTLYHPQKEAADLIKRYIKDVDTLIVWNNSPEDEGLKARLMAELQEWAGKIVWKSIGQNIGIAHAINEALRYAHANGFDLLLLMDQDSRWDDFRTFREDVEDAFAKDSHRVFCPYIVGNDTFERHQDIQEKRYFINSGTIIPVHLLKAINGADEAFPLDALDHDLAIRLQKAGYHIVCMTKHNLYHTIGQACRMGPFHIFTNNYGPERTYSMARAHLLKYRKHKDWLTTAEKRFIVKEYFLLKLLRILLAEPQKWKRLKMLVKGIFDGLAFDLSKTTP